MIELQGLQVVGPIRPGDERVLTREALEFVAGLARRFEPERQALLARRRTRAAELAAGKRPGFLDETAGVRGAAWQVAPAPPDLLDRRVEITGPVERKMMINALNSGARVFMADLEDANAPTWENVLQGQINLMDAVRRTIDFEAEGGKRYALGGETATLLVRPRGWHLVEKHVLVDGEPIAASLFDFGLYFFHNARALIQAGSGPYFYLPKLEGHAEARLWNEVFVHAQEALGLPRGTIRATVLIETILAAFEMEEILYELREHASGLNAGRWDYIFSLIKKFHGDPAFVLPDRGQVTMGVPFMRAYTELLVKTCHARGAHAIGGMAAFIPSRRDPAVNAIALAKVTEDKEREAAAGFDGTWVAHPDLVPVARAVFDRVLGERPNQRERLRPEVAVTPDQLLDVRVPDGRVTEAGLRNNVSVAIQYIAAWLAGVGAVAIFNLMEDAATAEISRAQLWQWLHHGVTLEDGRTVTRDLYNAIRNAELDRLDDEGPGRYREAAELLDRLVLADRFEEFLTVPAYMGLKP